MDLSLQLLILAVLLVLITIISSTKAFTTSCAFNGPAYNSIDSISYYNDQLMRILGEFLTYPKCHRTSFFV